MIRVMPGTLEGREHHSCGHSLEAHVFLLGSGANYDTVAGASEASCVWAGGG